MAVRFASRAVQGGEGRAGRVYEPAGGREYGVDVTVMERHDTYYIYMYINVRWCVLGDWKARNQMNLTVL